jgi:hypothetical protein
MRSITPLAAQGAQRPRQRLPLAGLRQWQIVKADDGQKILAIPPPLDVYRQLTRGPDAKVAS